MFRRRSMRRALRPLRGRFRTGQISQFLDANLPETFSAPRDASPAKRPLLLTPSPACGAAPRPDEGDWLDEVTAACAYCGSPVRE